MPSPRRDARPTRLISHIPAMGCVLLLIKGSLTLSKLCTAGSVALREQDGCQRVFGEKRGCSVQLAAEMGGRSGATVHRALLPATPARAAGRVPQPGAERGACFRASFLVKREVYNGNKSNAQSKWTFSHPVSSGAACGGATGACPHAPAGTRDGESHRGVPCVLGMGVQKQRGSNPCAHTSTVPVCARVPGTGPESISHVCSRDADPNDAPW